MATGGGVGTRSLETLPAVKEGIYDVYSKKVQPGRTWLSHYKAAFSSQSDIFLSPERPKTSTEEAWLFPKAWWWVGKGREPELWMPGWEGPVLLQILSLRQEGDSGDAVLFHPWASFSPPTPPALPLWSI